MFGGIILTERTVLLTKSAISEAEGETKWPTGEFHQCRVSQPLVEASRFGRASSQCPSLEHNTASQVSFLLSLSFQGYNSVGTGHLSRGKEVNTGQRERKNQDRCCCSSQHLNQETMTSEKQILVNSWDQKVIH